MSACDPEASDFVCPACRRPVALLQAAYICAHCAREYPILFGIPDFRLLPDQYLPFEEERAKAARLFDFGATHSFKELVEFYYSITDDVPTKLAPRFMRYVWEGQSRARAPLEALGPMTENDRLVDVGCGSGGTLVSAVGGAERVGVDIGLRWLVIAQKRLSEANVTARLVCGDVEALPFREGTYSHVIADDLLDHVRSTEAAIKGLANQLRSDGKLWISASNSWWLGPHPATGIWSAGLMPPALRRHVTRAVRGVDSLRNVTFVSSASVLNQAHNAGLKVVVARPRSVNISSSAWPTGPMRFLVRAYLLMIILPVIRQVLLYAGPAFEAVMIRAGNIEEIV